MKVISIRRCFYLCLCCLSMFFSYPGGVSATAYADGGAPQLAYVAGGGLGVSVIDIAKRRVTGTMALAGDPRTVLLSLDGNILYVTEPALGRVVAIMAKTGKTLCAASLPGQPSLLALSLDATVLYVAGQGDSRVRALNSATCAIEHIFETREPVYGLAVAASRAPNATPSTPNQLWITGRTSLTVFEVNGHLLGSIPIAGGPQNICIPGGFTAYVTTRQGTVVAVDLATRTVLRVLLQGGQFGPMDYDANTGEVYVPDREHNLLDVLSPVTTNTPAHGQEPARIISLNSSPQSVAITNDGQLGFVALANGQVLMLDIPGRSVITSISVGGNPHFIITGLYPSSNSTAPSQSVPATMPVSLILLVSLLVLVVVLMMIWLLRKFLQKRV